MLGGWNMSASWSDRLPRCLWVCRYRATFHWNHYRKALVEGPKLPESTEACASVTSAFLQVRRFLCMLWFGVQHLPKHSIFDGVICALLIYAFAGMVCLQSTLRSWECFMMYFYLGNSKVQQWVMHVLSTCWSISQFWNQQYAYLSLMFVMSIDLSWLFSCLMHEFLSTGWEFSHGCLHLCTRFAGHTCGPTTAGAVPCMA